MCTDVLILAGGSGERLWPVSDAKKPKQFMTLSDGASFLQSAVHRAAALGIEGEICIVTRKDWIDLVAADIVALSERLCMPELLSKVLVMCEPCGKNTAPAIAWTAKYLLSLKRSETVNMLVMASDHIIAPIESFAADVRTASSLAGENNLVTFAIPPLNPETGYGYIKEGKAVHCQLVGATPSFKIDAFREKPDSETARSYTDDGHYYWNSGIYAFRADFFLSELARHSPAVSSAFDSLGNSTEIAIVHGIRVMTFYEGLENAYSLSPSLSIDYAISEKCTHAVAVRASFQWDDVGTWDSLAKYSEGFQSNTVAIKTKNCFVNSDIPVALCGVEDLIVVIKNGKALVSRKGESNLVKDALSLMKQKGIS
jgi:mannose-1-phosphate guanylyltransferase